jgi:hypothetical protein
MGAKQDRIDQAEAWNRSAPFLRPIERSTLIAGFAAEDDDRRYAGMTERGPGFTV